MSLKIKELDKKDFKIAIEYAKVGMNFDVYFEKATRCVINILNFSGIVNF